MKKILLLLLMVVCGNRLFAQSATVNYTELNSYYSTTFASGGGMFFQSGNQAGQFANSSGSKQVISFRQFQTNGTNSGSARPLQVGDKFTIAASCIRAYGKIGIALLCSPAHENVWADRGDSAAISIDLDGPAYTGNGTYGNWYVRYAGGTTSAASFGGNTAGAYHDFIFVFTLTAPDRMNVTVTDNTTSTTSFFYDLLLNRSGPANPITDYCVYLQDDYEPTNNTSKNVFWGLSASSNESVVSTGALSIGASNNPFTESVVIPNGFYADQTTSGTAFTNALSKVGTAALTLSGSNTYSGITTINGGTLSVSADANLGTAPGSATPTSVTMNGGTLGVTTGFTLNANRGITVSSASTIDIATGQTLTWAGAFAGAGTLNKTSTGFFTLTNSGTGTYSGLTVSAGTVTLSGTAGNQMLGNVTVGTNGTLSMTAANLFGTSATPPFLTINGSFTSTNNSQNIAVTGTTGAISMGTGTLTISNTGSDIYAGTVAGSGGLIKANTGTQTLSGANTSLTGGVAVQQGTLIMGNANGINSTNDVTLGNSTNNGILSLNGNNTTVASLAISGTGTTNTVNNNNATLATLTINNSGSDTYGGILANGATGTLALIKTNTGNLTLSGTNTFTGAVGIQNGNLILGSTGALNSSNAITLGNSTNGGTLSLNGNNISVASITTSGSGTNTIQNANATGATLTVINASAVAYSGLLVDGTGGGALSVVENGSNVLTISGTSNTYTGSTKITAGTIRLGNNNALSTVSSLILDGGTFSTGTASVFSNSINNLQVTNNSTLALGTTGTHTITLTGTIPAWTAAKVLNITGWTGTAGAGGGSTSNGKIVVDPATVASLTTYLSQVNFGSPYSQGAIITATNELVPAYPVPSTASAGIFGTVSPHIINLSWTNGNGSARIVVIRNTSAVSFTPTPATTYDGANGHDYSAATDLTLAGQRCIYNSTGSSVTITGLTPGVTYNFAIYEYNGTAGSEVYGSAYTPASQATLGTFTAIATGNFTTAATWFNSDAPSAIEDFPVVVNANVNLTLNTNATVASLTINSGAPGGTFTATDGSARTLTISNNITGTTLSNSGTWANGTGASTVVFSGTATHTISGTIGFNNVTTNSTLNPGTGTTINGTLTLNSGGSIITNAVAYGTSATLDYNEGGGSGAKINTTTKEWPDNGATNIYIDNNSWIQIATSKSIIGNLYVNSGALQSTGGNTLTMNKTGNDTITVKNGNGTPGSIFGTDNGIGNNLTLTIASTSTTVFTGDATTNTDDNKKFFNINVNGTLRLQTGIVCNYGTFSVGSTGTLRVDGGGYVQSNNTTNGSNSGVAPTYSSGSLLKYSSNTTYGRGLEWSSTSGAGYPYNVQISGSTGTTLNLGANGGAAVARQCAGNLTIDALSNMNLATSSMTANLTVLGNIFINGTLTLSTSSGGNLQLGGNWYRNASTGTFTTNDRAVFFIGSNHQYVTVVGGGTETFAYLRINISASGKYLKPNNNLPDTTNIAINGSVNDLLDFNSNGSLDINGRRVGMDHNNSTGGNPAVWIYVPSAVTITDSAGVGNGEFKFYSSANPNQPTWFTSSVHNNAGVGSLTFDSNVLVSIADGSVDFGLSGSTYLTTINGTLQVKKGGSVGQTQNSCIYGASSTLLFANDIDYQVPANDKTWAAGAVTSGLPGIPWNVSVTSIGTNLTINSPRSVRGDLSIDNDTLTLNPTAGNTFSIGGSWTRQGSLSCFKNNAIAKVVFNGSSVQTISCSANGNVETFRGLEISNTSSGGVVSLTGSTSLLIGDSLILTHGVLTTGANTVVIPDTCIIKAGTGNSNYSVSWINGNLKRFFTNGSTATWEFPVGTATHGCLAAVKSNSMTFSGGTPPYYFTASFAGPLVKTGNNVDANLTAFETSIGGLYHTAYTSVNGAGSWKIEPSATTFTGTYDINLYFSGFTGLADNQFGILKRPVTSTTYADFKPFGGTLNATGGAGRTVAGGFALRKSLASFSEFVVGQAGAVLPITLTSFTGINDGGINNLAWTTATELNTEHFSLQRSSDAYTFTEIGTVKAAGFSVNNLNYTFVDDKPLSGINYYRLATVDLDGEISYSETIAISMVQLTANTVVVYPNPVLGNISFDINTPEASQVNYSLTDVLGRTIQTGQLNSMAGVNHYQLSGSALLHGVYFLNVSNAQTGLSTTTRLIKAE